MTPPLNKAHTLSLPTLPTVNLQPLFLQSFSCHSSYTVICAGMSMRNCARGRSIAPAKRVSTSLRCGRMECPRRPDPTSAHCRRAALPPSPLSSPYKLNESASPLLLQFRTRSSGMPPEAGANYAVRCRLARKLRLPGSGRWHAGKIQSDLPVIWRPQATEKCVVLFRVQCRRKTPRLGRCALHTLTFRPHSFQRADLKSPCVP